MLVENRAAGIQRMAATLMPLERRELAMAEPLPRVSQPQVDSHADEQTRFVQQNLRRIFLLIYRIVGNVDDAQDLTQETFIKALQRQGQT